MPKKINLFNTAIDNDDVFEQLVAAFSETFRRVVPDCQVLGFWIHYCLTGTTVTFLPVNFSQTAFCLSILIIKFIFQTMTHQEIIFVHKKEKQNKRRKRTKKANQGQKVCVHIMIQPKIIGPS